MPRGQALPRLPGLQPWVRCECDGGVPLDMLSTATNLPRGRRSKVWAPCDVWDVTQKKYLGWGGVAATTLLVTTDKAGRVLRVEGPEPTPGKRSEGEERVVRSKHLKVRPGVEVERVAGPFDGKCAPTFLVGGRGRGLGHPGIFQAVDTKAKARELAEMRLAYYWVVKDSAQYRALEEAIIKRKFRLHRVSGGGLATARTTGPPAATGSLRRLTGGPHDDQGRGYMVTEAKRR